MSCNSVVCDGSTWSITQCNNAKNVCEWCDIQCGACQWLNTTKCSKEGNNNLASECCAEITDAPTDIPSNEPTQSPTCPDIDFDSSSDACYGMTEECCHQYTSFCNIRNTTMCNNEWGASCCYEITDSPTESPTCPVKDHPEHFISLILFY